MNYRFFPISSLLKSPKLTISFKARLDIRWLNPCLVNCGVLHHGTFFSRQASTMKKMPINTYKQTYQNHQDSWWGMQLSPQRSGQECTSLEKSCFKSSSGVCHCYLPCKSPYYVQWNSNPNHPTDPSNF